MNLFHPRTLLLVAVALVVVLQGFISARFDSAACEQSSRGEQAGFPLDDAWIHQVYARSFGQRLRFEYNPGSAETGQSSLLWGVLLAPVNRLAESGAIPLGRATRWFGALLWIALALACAVLVTSLPIPGARFGGFVAAALCALDPALAFAAHSGMEPLLLSLCTVVAFIGLFRGRDLLCGSACGLAILTRPEGVLIALLVVGAALLLRRPQSAGTSARRPGWNPLVLPPLICAFGWSLFCQSVSGRPFPNTYYVKAGSGELLEGLRGGVELYAGLLTGTPFTTGFVGYLFLALGALALLLRCGSGRALILILTPLLFCLAVAGSRFMSEPDAFYWQRYLTPVIPLLNVLLAAGLAGAGATIMDTVRRPQIAPQGDAGAEDEPQPVEAGQADSTLTDHEAVDEEADPQAAPLEVARPAQPFLIPDVVLAVALMVMIVVPFAGAPEALRQRIELFASNVRDVDATDVEAALWLGEHPRIRAETIIATQDAGAVRYFTPVDRVIDLLGLNDHELIEVGLAGIGILEHVDRYRPDVLFLLDPDPGSDAFRTYGLTRGMIEVTRFTAEQYSLFGEPGRKSIQILSNLPP